MVAEKCKFCHEELELIHCFDTGTNDTSYAFNVYLCPTCFAVCRESVWSNKGEEWIEPLAE